MAATKTKARAGNTSFQAAFIGLVEKAGEIVLTFRASGHQDEMTHLQRQYFERVTEFLDAVDRDRKPQACGYCGVGTVQIGRRCSRCGTLAECSEN
jgi:tRNA(Ile2) C34 agmatinyltransferase TiaS